MNLARWVNILMLRSHFPKRFQPLSWWPPEGAAPFSYNESPHSTRFCFSSDPTNTMSMRMQTLNEEQEYNWTQKDSVNRRSGRDIVIAVDHGPKSRHAFDWALLHFCRVGDTIHLVHAVSSLKNNIVLEASQTLMEKLSMEAVKVAMVKIVTRIVEGDAGKAICKEADKVKPVAVIMGTRGRSLMQSVLQGSVSEYCFHNCKSAPVIIVPGLVDAGEESFDKR